jgi:hypothetical protein
LIDEIAETIWTSWGQETEQQATDQTFKLFEVVTGTEYGKPCAEKILYSLHVNAMSFIKALTIVRPSRFILNQSRNVSKL